MKLKGKLIITGQQETEFELPVDKVQQLLEIVEGLQKQYVSRSPGSKGPQPLTQKELDSIDRAAAKKETAIAIHDGKRKTKPKSKELSIDNVIEVAKLLILGFDCEEIGRNLGISSNVVRNIRSGFSWSWLTGFVHVSKRSKSDLYNPKYYGWNDDATPGPEALKRMRHRYTGNPRTGGRVLITHNPFLEELKKAK